MEDEKINDALYNTDASKLEEEKKGKIKPNAIYA